MGGTVIEDDRSWNYRPCVGIILIYDKRALLVRDPPRRTHWDVPQGGIDPGEEAPQAAIRELAEELGPEWTACVGRIIFIDRGQGEFPVRRDGRRYRGKTYYYHGLILVHLPPTFTDWEEARARNGHALAPAREYRDLIFATNAEARSLIQPRADNKAAMLGLMFDILSSNNLIR